MVHQPNKDRTTTPPKGTSDRNIIEWFNDNYIEDIHQIECLLENMEKYHSITKEQLLDGCKELRKTSAEKELLETHIRLFTNMTDVGINAHIAGVKLREAFIDTNTLNEL